MTIEHKLQLTVAGMLAVSALGGFLYFLCILAAREYKHAQLAIRKRESTWAGMHASMRKELTAQEKSHKKKNRQLRGLRVNRAYMNILAHVYRARVIELEAKYEDTGYRAHVSLDWLRHMGKLPDGHVYGLLRCDRPRILHFSMQNSARDELHAYCQAENNAVLDQMPALPTHFTLPMTRA